MQKVMKMHHLFLFGILLGVSWVWGETLPSVSCKEAWKTRPSIKTGKPFYIFDFDSQGYEAILKDSEKSKAMGCQREANAVLVSRSQFAPMEPTEQTLKEAMVLLDQAIDALTDETNKSDAKSKRLKMFQIYEHYDGVRELARSLLSQIDLNSPKGEAMKEKISKLPEASENYVKTKKELADRNAAFRKCVGVRPYQAFSEELEQNATRSRLDEKVPRSECYKEWTVLVAMDAKNDLMPFSLWDLLEMEAGYEARRDAGSTLKKDVVVQHHGVEDDVVRRLHIFQTDSHYKNYQSKLSQKYFESRSIHEVESPVVQAIDSRTFENKSDEFVSFIKWGMKNYPAKRYVIILWGHGKGWFKTDEGDDDVHLSGFELAEALKKIHLDEDGLNGQKKVDHFIADACLMQGVELATELASHTRYISGSAQIQAFMGLPYRVMFFEMEQTGKNFKRELRAQLKEEGQWESAPRLENGNVDWDALGYSPLRMSAEYLPRVMQRGFSSPSSFQGRLVKSDGDVQKGLDFFTFSTVDSENLMSTLEPALQSFAERFLEFVDSNADRLGDLKYPLSDITPFLGKRKTRELGSFLQLVSKFAEEFSKDRKEQLLDGALSDLDKAELEKDVLKSDRLIEAANLARGALIFAVPEAYFAPVYLEPYDWFRGLGVWIPKNSSDYEKGTALGFNETKLFQGEMTPWHRMIRLMADVGD